MPDSTTDFFRLLAKVLLRCWMFHMGSESEFVAKG